MNTNTTINYIDRYNEVKTVISKSLRIGLVYTQSVYYKAKQINFINRIRRREKQKTEWRKYVDE